MLLQLLVGIGMMILGYILMPKPKQEKQEVQETDNPTASAGKPMPVLFGEKLIKEPNFLGYWDKSYAQKKQKAKKK